MDCWEKSGETSPLQKEDYYINLNEEDISNTDYAHCLKVWEVFKIKDSGDYHDLDVQSDTLLLADAFENFRDECIEIYELDPANFLSAPGLAWQACLKRTWVKLELLTHHDMLMMVEKGIKGGICQAISRYVKVNNKYIGKKYEKKKN